MTLDIYKTLKIILLWLFVTVPVAWLIVPSLFIEGNTYVDYSIFTLIFSLNIISFGSLLYFRKDTDEAIYFIHLLFMIPFLNLFILILGLIAFSIKSVLDLNSSIETKLKRKEKV